MFTRQLQHTIVKNQQPGIINLIYGPRRVGKSTLLHSLTDKLLDSKVLWINGDIMEDREIFSTTSMTKIKILLSTTTHLVVDEAQQIPSVGETLKIIVDYFPNLYIYVTGSSSLTIQTKAKSSLTGRHQTYYLYPLSTYELSADTPSHQVVGLLDSQLIYGGYPYLSTLSQNSQKRDYLKTLINDYLFQDLYDLSNINKPRTIEKLATLLAFQIGSQVSYNELATQLGVDVKTIQSYLELLKQIFVIQELPSYSTNLRSELKKSKKYYFLDLGIRNALCDSFQPLELRPDLGALWENFLYIEKIKQNHYQNLGNNYYFWRNYTSQEVDLLETSNTAINAYEFKWNKSKIKPPKAWSLSYPNSIFKLVNRHNYLEFIS